MSARVSGDGESEAATGDVEVVPTDLRILNRADVLPFPLDADIRATKICA